MEKPVQASEQEEAGGDQDVAEQRRALGHRTDDLFNENFGRYGAEEFKKNQEAKVDGTQTGCAACIRATSVQGGVRTTYISIGVIHDHVYKPEYSVREEPDGT